MGKCKHVEKQQHVEKEPMKSFLQKGRGGMQNMMRQGNWKKRNQEQCSLNLTGLYSEIGTKE